MLDYEIKTEVSCYIKYLIHNTLIVIERLDIWEFRMRRKPNGMFSMFTKEKAQESLIKTLNLKGFDFVEVDPDYTSQIYLICHNLDKENLHDKVFRRTRYGYTRDDDYTASLNIRERTPERDYRNRSISGARKRIRSINNRTFLFWGSHGNYYHLCMA